MRQLARVFKALADETRLQMVGLILHHGELCVCDCMQVLEVSQSKASRHLRYLANAGLLNDRREGVWVYYRIAEETGQDRCTILEAVKSLVPPGRIEDLSLRLEEWLRVKVDSAPRGCQP